MPSDMTIAYSDAETRKNERSAHKKHDVILNAMREVTTCSGCFGSVQKIGRCKRNQLSKPILKSSNRQIIFHCTKKMGETQRNEREKVKNVMHNVCRYLQNEIMPHQRYGIPYAILCVSYSNGVRWPPFIAPFAYLYYSANRLHLRQSIQQHNGKQ